MNENAVEQVTTAKALGVYVDQNIKWEYHIENMSYKTACAIGAIKQIRHLTSFKLKFIIALFPTILQCNCGETVTSSSHPNVCEL